MLSRPQSFVQADFVCACFVVIVQQNNTSSAKKQKKQQLCLLVGPGSG
jgi:hypothetical protein